MEAQKSKILLCVALSISALSSSVNAMVSDKLVFLEGGFSYSHAYYENSATFAESSTQATPTGYSINPNDFYPQNYYGGYIGLSLYSSNWLLNTRYDMYSSESKTNSAAGTKISLAPARLSLSLDRVWGQIDRFSYGIGAGVVNETLNKGEANIAVSTDNPSSESLQGRSRLDPLVEGFLMYHFSPNLGTKLNVAYQIPLNNKFGRGDLNVNLGLNYSLPL